ncbi:MAG: aromatic-ring-hydroxylating dioxygenase subunit beta [Rubrivivax sp.]
MRFSADEWLALHELHAEYAAALDARELDRWPALFTEACSYKLQSRENFERGLPLCILHLDSRAMLADRVYGAQETIYHDPYAQRHVGGPPRLLTREGDALVTETPVLVVRTKRDAMPEVLLAGRYLDRVVPTAEGLRFAQRWLVFDNDLLANSIVDPA